MQKTKAIGFAILAGVAITAFQNFTSSNACSQNKINELLADATTSGKAYVHLNCSVKLDKAYKITKQVLIRGSESSNITLDFKNSTLDTGSGGTQISVYSKKIADGNGVISYARPENVYIKNLKVKGSIRLSGMSTDELRAPSRSAGYTKLAQAAAPKNIQFDNIQITAQGNIPIYVSPGVTYFRLENSKIDGTSKSVAIYLDAESGHHVIKNNRFQSTNSREVIAVDGSAQNLIANNYFSGLDMGGIYLYRNCGERSVTRQQNPTQNAIMNNTFYYKSYSGGNPAVFIGSRQGGKKYCGDDADSKYGSGVSDLDYARNNAIVGNQVFQNPSTRIKDNDKNNLIESNIQVSSAIDRKAACFMPNAIPSSRILASGDSTNYIVSSGETVCNGYAYTCNDGEISRKAISCPEVKTKTVSFQCKVEGNNAGCSGVMNCPDGYAAVSARGACNLETQSLTAAQLEAVPWNKLSVTRESDSRSDGHCSMGGTDISSGSADISSLLTQKSVNFACREYDKNGSDCIIRVQYMCVKK